ncbi:MAG: hypothetical protein MUF49_08880 [Oculatellaceae cyanobacterium Prado106]|nr:hypothetical protein [Oculatellaceae cyanobacterium Prado106]
MGQSIGVRLEQYTLKRPQEVLLVTAIIADEEDQIAIFRGFSSSLMHPTAPDPDVPILPEEAKVLTVDRLAAPYNPNAPRFIEQGLSWEGMQALLVEVGV